MKQSKTKPLSGEVKHPKNVKCNCGHYLKDHYRGGWCHSSGHPKEGECGCTFYAPNDKWILKHAKKKID